MENYKPFLIFLLSMIAAGANSQEPGLLNSKDTLHVSYKTKYTPFPNIGYTPDTRLIVGAVVLKQFKPGKAVLETRPSNILALSAYTLNKQASIESHYTIFFPKEYWVWKGDLVVKKWPESYWGTGPLTKKSDEIKVDYQNIEAEQSLLRKITGNLYAGPKLHFTHMYKVKFKNKDNEQIAPPDITGAEGSTNFGAGISFMIDKRNSVLTPTTNYYVELSALFYSKSRMGDYNFQSYLLDARKYFDFKSRGRDVLALNIQMKFTNGTVPFKEMGLLGGKNIMRGYEKGRFRDKNIIQAQVEYRKILKGRFGAVLFAAAGNVMPGLKELKIDNTKWALGAGLRYNINKADPTYLRIDYGFGKGTGGFYITLGEAF